ncbi:PHP domain-containing protein [Haloferax sp. YSSS75]|uniref:PHP domain-containing protein n=1 Tax=Haloferax sp. YSSS75 TaxID=3388564 RepID=UPI00398CD8C0
MKRWHKYEQYLLSGLWHVHTDLTDGSETITDLVEFASNNNYPLIGFTEHIRRSPTYDFQEFYQKAKNVACESDLKCVVGCEAKVLNQQGELDISNQDLGLSDIVYAAYHGTPFSKSEYLDSVYSMLENPRVDVWAHPLVYPSKSGFSISNEVLSDLFSYAKRNNVLIEKNLRYCLPRTFSETVHENFDILGYDVHQLNELGHKI